MRAQVGMHRRAIMPARLPASRLAPDLGQASKGAPGLPPHADARTLERNAAAWAQAPRSARPRYAHAEARASRRDRRHARTSAGVFAAAPTCR